jgi:ABC-type nitrate/sulfonate/bicarbonate transport system permease component
MSAAATTPAPPDRDRSIETEFSYGFRQYARRYGPLGIVVLNLAIFFAIWQILASAKVIDPLFLPTVTGMLKALRDGFADGTLTDAVLWSLRNFAIGLGLACLVGIPLGLIMGASRVVYAIFSPYVWSMQSLPRVAVMPLLILIFGFSVKAELTLIFISALFPLIINCMSGVKTVEPSLVRAGHVFGASKFDIYRRVIFPYTLPFILSGVNQGMSRGLVGMVIAEIFGGNNGLGYVTQRAGETFNSALLYGALLILVVVALTFVQGVRWLEAKAAPWRNQGVGA